MSQPGYKYLKTYQISTVIYDLTVEFCNKFLSGFDFRRTREQMVQAARSHKQNIAEGYLEKSLKSYIKLLGVSRASLEELLEDFRDFLRVRKLCLWSKEDLRVREIRAIRVILGPQGFPITPILPDNPEKAANLLITFGMQNGFLLDNQIRSLEEKFIKEGGYTEKLLNQRLKFRNKPDHLIT